MDSGFYLVTRNIVDSFLSRRDQLQCLVWEAQAIGYWLKNVSNLTTFADNKRILHRREGFSSQTEASQRKEICHSVVGIHQSYPEWMRLFWRVYLREESVDGYDVPPISYDCKYPIGMDISAYRNPRLFNLWYSDLKPCKDNPTWDRGKVYKGRGGV